MQKPISNPSDLMQVVNGFRISRVILTAYELGIFTRLKNKARSSSDVAKDIKSDERATDRLMNALVGLGLLVKKQGSFSNAPFSEKFLVKGERDYMGNLGHAVNLWKTWGTLTDCVMAGRTVAVDQPIVNRGDDWLEAFIAAMHFRGPQQAAEVEDCLDLSAVRKILDVGGGSGLFSFEFIRRNKQAKAVIFDLPTVIPLTKKYIALEGFSDSVSTFAGDYLKNSFESGYDLVFVSAVIHINSADENKTLVKKCADALNSEGHLVIVDHLMSEDRTEPVMGALFALNMLVGTEKGDTYTEREIRTWMQEAGLTGLKRLDTPSGTGMMIGTKQ
jgi:SAM-dependent methyltransferase